MLLLVCIQNLFLGAVGLLAHLASKNKIARYILYTLLSIQALVFLGVTGMLGIGMFVLPKVAHKTHIPAKVLEGIDPLFGMMLTAFILTLTSLLTPGRKLLSKILPIQTHSLPHMLGLCVAAGYIPFMAGQILFFYDLKAMVKLMQGTPLLLSLVLSGLGFLWIAFGSVGIGITRSFSQVLNRLGLTKLSWSKVGLSIGLAIILNFVMAFLSQQLSHLFPADMKDLQAVLASMKLPGEGVVFVLECILAALFTGLSEEILFRGLLQPAFGIVLSSVLFMLLHVQYGPTSGLAIVFVLALILGYQRKKWNTTASFITHSTYNLIGFLMMSLSHH